MNKPNTNITPIITDGQIFKNYKVMCNTLGLPILQGNSKKSQMNYLSQFFKLKQDGQKLTIVKVLKPIYSKEDFQRDNDILDNYIECLLLKHFIDQEKTEIYVSKSKLWLQLGMINKDYSTAGYETINEEHKRYNGFYFKEWIFNNFKSRVNQTITNKLEQTLNHLQKRRLIDWDKVYFEITEHGDHYIVDSPAKRRFIMSCERRAIDKVVGKTVKQKTNDGNEVERQSNLNDVYRMGLFKKYEKILNRYLWEKKIKGVYRKYHIILNEKELLEQALDIDCKTLCRKVNDRIVGIIDKGADSVGEKYSESKADVAEIQKWLTHRLIYLGWHIEHFFDKPIKENKTGAELEKDIPWKITA